MLPFELHTHHILFAAADDDCLLFKNALDELPVLAQPEFVYNGDQLMQTLNKTNHLPDLLFPDLNMPRKNGLKCLMKMKKTNKLKDLPVVIYSTSFQKNVVDLLYQQGTQFYIRKPTGFSELKNIVLKTLSSITKLNYTQPSKESFMLSHAML